MLYSYSIHHFWPKTQVWLTVVTFVSRTIVEVTRVARVLPLSTSFIQITLDATKNGIKLVKRVINLYKTTQLKNHIVL